MIKDLLNLDKKGRMIMSEVKDYASLFDVTYNKAIYNEYKGGETIAFIELKAITRDTKLKLPTLDDKCKIYSYRKRSDVDGNLIFKGYFSNGSTLPRHKHDCIEEVTPVNGDFEVTLGREEEETFKVIFLSAGELLSIPANLPHQFKSLSEGLVEMDIRYLKQ